MTETVDSAGDDRTANNVVRHEYRVLTDDEKGQMLAIKDAGRDFILLLQSVGGTADYDGHTAPGHLASRELSIAQTKMEEAVMWAVKHVTT